MNSRFVISVLLLVCAVLAFASLSYTPVTVLRTTTESESSYYVETLTSNYCCGTVYVTLSQPASILLPFATNYTLTPTPSTMTSSVALLTAYAITQTLTTHIFASETLGLSHGAFIFLALTVVGILALFTGWIGLSSRRRK